MHASRANEAATVAGRFQGFMEASRDPVTAPCGSLWRAMYRCTAANLWAEQALMFVRSCATFAGPAIMARLLAYLETGGTICAWRSHSTPC